MNKYFLLLFVLAFGSSFGQEIDYSKVNDGFDRIVENVGGAAELKRVFEQEVIYPAKDLEAKKGGTVKLHFLVMSDGAVRELKIFQPVTSEIDSEAVRIFRLLLWKPTIYRGKAVNTYHDITLQFDPAKYKKICKKRGYTQVIYPHQPVDTTSAICEKPDEQPLFPAGNYALQELIGKNLQYPQEAAVRNLEGTVMLSFIVEPSGMMTNIYIEKSVGGGCNEEAIRVLKMIKWNPGIKDGKAVRTKMSLPFVFSLVNSFRDNTHSEQGH
jgi:TonB family protein